MPQDHPQTHLFAWNPKNFVWETLEGNIQAVRETGRAVDRWSCAGRKSIPVGSRFFLIRLTVEPRGIVGAGVTTSEVREEPHWQRERAEQGETAPFVDIKFDYLSRVPLLRRSELDAAPFDAAHWDIQSSGVAIPRDVAGALEQEWTARLKALERGEAQHVLSPGAADRWIGYWSQMSSDQAWLERHRSRDLKRREVVPEIRGLIQSFIDRGIDLVEFREEFDHKTRSEWDYFGLKGLSGAMFLNKIAKHIPDPDEAAEALRLALEVPEGEEEARAKIEGLMSFFASKIANGEVSTRELQPNRTPFFVSACWHLQAIERWPLIYQSARHALQADGLLGRHIQGADGYLEFARVFRALSDALGISLWDVEHLCQLGAPHESGEDGTEAVPTDEEQEDEISEQVWLISPGRRAKHFDEFFEQGIVAIGWDYLGDLSQYEDAEAISTAMREHEGADRNPVQNSLACYQFAQEMKVGDVLFAKRGRREIVGYGVVTSEYRHEADRQSFRQVRSVDWRSRGEWTPREKPFVMKTLTEIGKYPGMVADIRKALGIAGEEEDEVNVEVAVHPPYSIEEAQKELFHARSAIEEPLELLRYKKNLVLQGPPGVGKTFFAKRLAHLLLGEKDPARVEQVQFHQSYSYEDFVQGYRPTAGGAFGRVDGPFLRFCDSALQDMESPYVLIIDEINRGNLSKIFGELMLLLEHDKRSKTWATTLTYSVEGEPRFYVPSNLYIIGTMNTADRSLAMVDYALRRRFAFLDVQPSFEHPGFARRLKSLGAAQGLITRIIDRLSRLNVRIGEDHNLGDGFRIGHSYFCSAGEGLVDDDWYERVIRTEIQPLLKEYWFDDVDRADEETAQLLGDD